MNYLRQRLLPSMWLFEKQNRDEYFAPTVIYPDDLTSVCLSVSIQFNVKTQSPYDLLPFRQGKFEIPGSFEDPRLQVISPWPWLCGWRIAIICVACGSAIVATKDNFMNIDCLNKKLVCFALNELSS